MNKEILVFEKNPADGTPMPIPIEAQIPKENYFVGSSGGTRTSQIFFSFLGVDFDQTSAIFVLKEQKNNAGALKFYRKLWTYKNSTRKI